MRAIYLVIFILIASCQQGSNNKPTAQNNQPIDPCDLITQTLNGTFSTGSMEGTMVWNGGMSGSVEISGLDYNDITCTYTVSDCSSGVVQMRCDGSAYSTDLVLFTQDSMKLGQLFYTRVMN